jgi:DNA repair photolyase
MDLYQGCPHGCVYCFSQSQFFTNQSLKGVDFEKVRAISDIKKLEKYLKGEYSSSINPSTKLLQALFLRKQPIHIGGMFDPFPDRYEQQLQHAKRVLELLIKYDYPAIISTKNPPVEYADLFAKGKFILQVSLICLDEEISKRLEKNAPSPKQRLEAIKKLKNNFKKVIVRLQPFIPYLFETEEKIKKYVQELKEAGADAVTIEFLKASKFQTEGVTNQYKILSEIVGIDIIKDLKSGSSGKNQDLEYNLDYKFKIIKKIKKIVKEAGLEFYSAENKLRSMGDGYACCGLKGTEPDFQSKIPCFNQSLFIAKEKGTTQWEDLTIPEEYKIQGIQHMWNTQSRKVVQERKNWSTETFLKRAWNTNTEMNPSIFFKGLTPKKQKEKIIYEYQEYENDQK